MIEHFYTCPWCWPRVSLLIDAGVDRFEGIEDCEVCCNPIQFTIELENGRVVRFTAQKAQ